MHHNLGFVYLKHSRRKTNMKTVKSKQHLRPCSLQRYAKTIRWYGTYNLQAADTDEMLSH